MTNNTLHTPGPWQVHRSLSNTNATPIRANGENLAWVCGKDSAADYPPDVTLANANLIAAAPEMLEAAKEVESMLRTMYNIEGPHIRKLRAAISKAEGRS